MNKWMKGYLAAWDLLVDLPLGTGDFDNVEIADDDFRVAASFPLVGFTIGLILCVPTVFFSVLGGPLASAILSSLAVSVLMELIDSGKGSALFVRIISQGFSKNRFFRDSISSPAFSENNYLSILLAICLFLFRTACIAVLIAKGHSFWLIAVMTGAFAVQSQMVSGKDMDGDGGAFLDTEPRALLLSWFFAFIICFVFTWSFAPVLVTFILLIFFAHMVRILAENSFGGVNSDIVTLCGYASTTFILGMGVLFFTRA